MICLSLAEKKLVQDWSFWMKALVMGLLAKYAVAVVFKAFFHTKAVRGCMAFAFL